MNKIEQKNGHVFVRPLKETKKTGGLELISKLDEQDRYSKAEVVFCEEVLNEGDIILYDKNNGHGFQINDELLTVLRLGDVVGVCEE